MKTAILELMELQQLRERVFRLQPVLANLYQRHGRVSLSGYVASWQTGPPEPSEDQAAMLGIFRRLAGVLYGQRSAAAAADQLAELPLVSTIDHHGLLGHPFFINANLLFSLRRDARFVISLPTAGVSLNNSSWPGALVYGRGGLDRYSIFPDRLKTRPVLAVPAAGQAERRLLAGKLARDSRLSGRAAEVLSLADQCLDWREESGFAVQAAMASPKLWRCYFPSAPQLIYLPLESLVKEFLIRRVLQQPGHILSRLLCEPEGLVLAEKHFRGAQGGFGVGQKGSFLFWGLSSSGKRLPLAKTGSLLQGQGVSVRLGAESLGQALSEGRIYPGSWLCFMTMLLCGVACVGGFNQVNWLTEIKRRLVSLLQEASLPGRAAAVLRVPSDNFAETNLAFLPESGRLSQAAGLDLWLSGRDFWPVYRSLSDSLSLAQSIDSSLPEVYRVVVPAAERDNRLLGISSEQIMDAAGWVGRYAAKFE